MQVYLPHRRKHHSFQNNYSLQFDGVDEYVEAPTYVNISGNNNRTYSMWIKCSNPALWLANVGYTGAATPGQYWRLVYNPTNNAIYASDGSRTARWTSLTNLGNNTWRHFAFVYSGNFSTFKLYVNGSEHPITSHDSGATNTGTAINFSVSKSDGSGFFHVFSGKIDEYTIWDKALSGSEVTELYNSGDPANALAHSAVANLKHYWRMGDGDSSPTITDRKGSLNLTMTNQESGDIQTDVP